MTEKHVPPSRLARARELAVALIDELPEDRVGSVVFAGAASHLPLTEDHEVAARFLYDLGPADLTPGSNLSEVFRVASCVLTPTVPILPPRIADLVYDDVYLATNMLSFRLTEYANRLDLPSISIPGDLRTRRPYGMMLTGPRADDDRLLDIAVAVEQALTG